MNTILKDYRNGEMLFPASILIEWLNAVQEPTEYNG